MTSPRQHRLRVSRTARYYTLGEQRPGVSQVWFVCHGYGQLAGQFIRYFQVLDDGSRLIVAPEGLSRHYTGQTERKVGASWMTREDRLAEIDDYVAYLDALHDEVVGRLEPPLPSVYVLGFSQGAATASRWVVQGKVAPTKLITWGGWLPPDLDLDLGRDALSRCELIVVTGDEDEYVGAAALSRERQRLAGSGIRFRTVTFDGGHRLDKEVLRALV